MSKNYGVKIKYMAKVRPSLMIVIIGKIEQLHYEQASPATSAGKWKKHYTKVKKVSEILDTNEPNKKGQFYLFLDQITDPQNFGSILRTAMFIGVDAVIVNSKNSCGLTPTVSKVSSGALEFIPLYNVRFVSKFLEDAQSGTHNFKVISTDI